LQEEAAAARAEALEDERKAQELAAELLRTPRELPSGGRLSNPAQAELAQLRGQLELARVHLAPDHPTIVRLTAAIQTLEGQRASTPLVRDSVDVSRNPLHQALESQLSETKVARAAALAREQTALERPAERPTFRRTCDR
jgi:hypothetical protein